MSLLLALPKEPITYFTCEPPSAKRILNGIYHARSQLWLSIHVFHFSLMTFICSLAALQGFEIFTNLVTKIYIYCNRA